MFIANGQITIRPPVRHSRRWQGRHLWRPDAEKLEDRSQLSIAIYNGAGGNGLSRIGAFTGVGFALNPVAELYGHNNGAIDNNPADYSVQISWGDGGSSGAKLTVDPNNGNVLVNGSHFYETIGNFDVTINATGPGGETASASTCQVIVASMPDALSIPPDVPKSFPGTQPLGDVDLSLYNGAGGNGLSSISAFAGVGFALSPVAEAQGTYNTLQDETPSDYRAQINWGDSPSWDSAATLSHDPTTGNVQIEGSYIYEASGNYAVTV
jgi:hypothetical protein